MNVAHFPRTAAAAIVTTLLAVGAATGIGAQMSHSDGRTKWADGSVPTATATAGNSGHSGTEDVTWGS
ncbi:hypothetical protein [Streptomyces sp. NPDC020298]|uniref:hypothetical protein n=1 Tax=unclassified Streptomyces TaxID=2593676 RepID=UPI0033F0522B